GTVTWDAAFSGTATVTVVANNGCGSSSPISTNITVNPLVGTPTAISGITNRCKAGGTDAFTTSATNATSYTWNINTGGSISGTGTTGTVSWLNGFGPGTSILSVTATNQCGTSSTVTHNVFTFGSTPSQPSVITGTTDRCQGSGTDNFSVTAAGDAVSYNW